MSLPLKILISSSSGSVGRALRRCLFHMSAMGQRYAPALPHFLHQGTGIAWLSLCITMRGMRGMRLSGMVHGLQACARGSFLCISRPSTPPPPSPLAQSCPARFWSRRPFMGASPISGRPSSAGGAPLWRPLKFFSGNFSANHHLLQSHRGPEEAARQQEGRCRP